ncbi:radical SAM protein [Candidatus Woesearchaeota archaeon CG10_big_fil_rev_8_21_14_0_10_36_11]|nr:MAG: radical SAM protein [Candidatus Woesearchaeota archaeon CG10_big_fil_rev_8_21_14_0_10_36_11]
MQRNKYRSYNKGPLPKGCQYCVKGEKLVIFVTGNCPRHCYFCPVSDEKYQNDVQFANERNVTTFADISKEARAMDAKGAGITGGDPLEKLERTCEYITKLKQEFGKEFHIHLYTSLNLVTNETLQKLFTTGLDEIRFHLDLENTTLWKKLSLAKEFSWDIGVEVPLIPNKEQQLKEMVDFIHDKVDFCNLNELEVADNDHSSLLKMGFVVKDQLSYAIEGSQELGIQLIEYVEEKGYDLPVHVCTATLKDATQLANRIKREADNVKRSFDTVDAEGMLTRGALYLKTLTPGFGYREKLKRIDKEKYVLQLKSLRVKIKEKLKCKDEDICIDMHKPRILLSKNALKRNVKFFKKCNLVPAIVVEYPTADQLETEVTFL